MKMFAFSRRRWTDKNLVPKWHAALHRDSGHAVGVRLGLESRQFCHPLLSGLTPAHTVADDEFQTAEGKYINSKLVIEVRVDGENC